MLEHDKTKRTIANKCFGCARQSFSCLPKISATTSLLPFEGTISLREGRASFHNGSNTGNCTWKSRLERARKILHGKKILKGKRGRRALPTSAWKALDKAAVIYQSSPRLQTSYASKAQYYNKKVGHLFRNSCNDGCMTWNRRLYRVKKLLCNNPIFKDKKTQEDVFKKQLRTSAYLHALSDQAP